MGGLRGGRLPKGIRILVGGRRGSVRDDGELVIKSIVVSWSTPGNGAWVR